MKDSILVKKVPNPEIIESEGEKCIICNCIYYSSACFLVPVSVCKKYKNKYYCSDCRYISDIISQKKKKQKPNKS